MKVDFASSADDGALSLRGFAKAVAV